MSFRFVVTDSFGIPGRGTVVVGVVEGGPIEVGQLVPMHTPDGREQRVLIAGIEVFQRELERAEPGGRVGLLLRGIDPPPQGTVLGAREAPAPDPDPEPDTPADSDPRASLDGVELTSRPTVVPLFLLPLRLETSFEGRTLRIRAFPDQIHVDSFDPRLTEEEVQAGRLYLEAAGRDQKGARSDLEATLGPARGRVVAERADAGGAAALQVESDGGLNRRAVARGLPRKLIAHGMAGGRGFTVEGREIPMEIPVAPGGGDVLPVGDGSLLDWMVDFRRAEEIGLALSLPIDALAAEEGLDWLYVFGVDGASDGAGLLTQLMQAHVGTVGASTLAPLTPTKGSPQEAPIFAVKGARAEGAERLARDLGMRDGLPLSQPAAPDHSRLARSVATIVWEATLRPALVDLYGTGADTLARTREVFVAEVHPFGPYPTLRIGELPYFAAPVHVPSPSTPGQGGPLLRQVGDAIRSAIPAVVEAAEDDRSGAGDPGGYSQMVDTLLRHPIGQHWRLRSRTAAEAYLTPLARAARTQDVSDAAEGLMDDITAGRQLLTEFGLAVDGNARIHAAIGDAATPTICGPLVSRGAAADRSGEPLADPGLQDVLSARGFWAERVSSVPPGRPYHEGEDDDAEPVLRLFVENAVLQVLADLAVAEDLASGRDAELVARGALDPGVTALPREAWHLRCRLAAAVEQAMGGASLAELVSRFRARTIEGQARLSDLRDVARAIQDVNNGSAGGAHAVFAAVLDGLSTRADVWLMAEAREALEREHSLGRSGLSLGAWGVLQDVRPGRLAPTRHASAPSQEFATTLGLLERARRGLSTTGLDAAIRAELSGPRVAEARELLELLRQGRAVDAALSRRVAEKLNAAGRGPVLKPLAAEFPLEGGGPIGSACDGLSFLESTNLADVPGLDAADLSLLSEIQMDLRAAVTALGELHLVEGAAALSQRRVEAAQAVLAGLSAGTPPTTDLSVLTPSSAGNTLGFSVVVCVDPSGLVQGAEDLRARLNPTLALLAERLLGPMEGSVSIAGSADPPQPLRGLELSALSLAYLAAPGADALDRLASYVGAHLGLEPSDAVEFDDAARSTIWAAGRLAAVIGQGRPLGDTDFPEEAHVVDDASDGGAARRAAVSVLEQLRDTLSAGEPATSSGAASLFAAGLIPAPDPGLVEDARAAIAVRLDKAAAAEGEGGALELLLGDMPVVNLLRCEDVVPWDEGRLLQGAQREELFVWLEESQAVRSRLAPLADLVLGAESTPLDVRAVQWPGTARPSQQQQVDWIGGELRENDVYSARSSSVVIGGGVGSNGLLAGLLIDSWIEVVPDETQTAGVVVDSPSPASRAPQLMLLAAPGGDGAKWTPASVLDVLETTMAIGRVRTVGLGTLPEEAPHNGVFGRLGKLIPVGAIRSTDTSLARAACPPVPEG